MSNPNKTLIEHFDNGAAKYDASTAGCTRELARYLVEISPSFDQNSHVLDNAAGTGIVAQEVLLKRYAEDLVSPRISCVDGAAGMVDLARKCCHPSMLSKNDPDRIANLTNEAHKMSFGIMSGEQLDFPDDYFTHSYTNQGLQFFNDPVKGASEIFRTLKPGGTAMITTWADLGYLHVIHEAQQAVNPDAPLLHIPIAKEWYHAATLEKTLMAGGFNDVKVQEKKVYFASKTVSEICELLLRLFANFPWQLSEDERSEFRKQLESAVAKSVVKIKRVVAGEMAEWTEEVVGIPMVALVAIATK